MNNEEAIEYLGKHYLAYIPFFQENREQIKKHNKVMDIAIECIEKQSNIVHCKDCKNWSYPYLVEGFNKNAQIGFCKLTKWLCGEQGYCMYGSEEERCTSGTYASTGSSGTRSL